MDDEDEEAADVVVTDWIDEIEVVTALEVICEELDEVVEVVVVTEGLVAI